MLSTFGHEKQCCYEYFEHVSYCKCTGVSLGYTHLILSNVVIFANISSVIAISLWFNYISMIADEDVVLKYRVLVENMGDSKVHRSRDDHH